MDKTQTFSNILQRTPQARQSTSSFSSRKSFLGGSNKTKPVASIGGQSISGRSNNQSILGIRSEYNAIESYGFQLPVLVNEALTFTEKSPVSVMCAPNGWSWVVVGRRLLVWQYKSNRNAESGASPTRLKDLTRSAVRRAGAITRELTLPQCDIGHKASLVSVFLNESSQMASCVAVSPTGDVRYWPSIAHDGSTVDASGILADGQEFERILNIPQHNGFILVTTTCSLVFLQLQLVNGRHVLQHKSIRQSSGFLGGIGKKFASIIIGMNGGGDKENKYVGIACERDPAAEDEVLISVLSDRWLQRWRLRNKGQSEQLLYEDNEIIRLLLGGFQAKFWNARVDSNVEVELHMLDMHVGNGKTYVLAGAVNNAHTPQMFYAIGVLLTKDDAVELESFIPLKITQFFNSSTERECLNLRFIVCRTHLYLYNDKTIYPLNLTGVAMNDIEAEKIEFQMQDDRILNAAVCGQIPLFFSRTHGLICVTPGDFDNSDYFNMSTQSARHSPDVFIPLSENTLRSDNLLAAASESNLYMFDLDPDAMYNELKDEVSQFKAAFVYRLKGNNNMCNVVLNDLLRSLSSEAQMDAVNEVNQLDRIVVTIAEELAEDIPAADPRWEQLWEENSGYKHAIGSSSSLQILTQLQEKNLALRHFIDFLHYTGVWESLTAVPSGKTNMPKATSYIIADINEKIQAAIALRTIQSKYMNLIDEAIKLVVTTEWKEKPRGNLTTQDLFYVHLCKFQHIFPALLEIVNKRIEAQQQATQIANLINDVNIVVLYVVTEVMAFREQNIAIFTPIGEKLDNCEYLPWTAISDVTNVCNQLIELSVRYGARCATEIELRQRLCQQVYDLIDVILDGKKVYLDSVRDTEKYNVVLQQYEAQRRHLISILIEEKQYEYAANLAEKYLDFPSLLVICDETDDQQRLNAYIQRYEEYDFSQFAINWHLRQNRQGEVFERFKGNPAALSQFMRDHPSLGWIQLIFNGDFERASKILFQLAQAETEYLARKKSMLSLAKLSSLAAPDADLTEQIDGINIELKLIEYQEEINAPLLEVFGYDSNNQKVLRVEEIINMYICEENETASERDFRRAIELLAYVEEPYETRHKIWCTAIMRDNWTDYDVDNALEYLQGLLFFKLIEMCHFMGSELDSFLPPITDFLNTAELGELPQKQPFQYLLKLTYEYATQTFKKADDIIDN